MNLLVVLVVALALVVAWRRLRGKGCDCASCPKANCPARNDKASPKP